MADPCDDIEPVPTGWAPGCDGGPDTPPAPGEDCDNASWIKWCADQPPLPVEITGGITIDNIDIEELDVTAGGVVAVPRCTVDCGRIDVLVWVDEDHANGQGVTTDNGTLSMRVIGWVDAAGAISSGEPPMALVPCDTCEPDCSPSVESTTGDAPRIGGVHQLDVDNPTCCPITVTTSIGRFTVPAGRSHHLAVDCPFDVLDVAIQGDCDPTAITLTGVRTH